MKQKVILLALSFVVAGSAFATDSQPTQFISRISNIDLNRTAIGAEGKLIRGEKLTFVDKTDCGAATISMNNDSLGIAMSDYRPFLEKIWRQALDDNYFMVKTSGCHSEGSELVTQLKMCEKGLCDDKYLANDNVLWLNKDLEKVYKRNAFIAIKMPLAFDERNKLWKVDGYYVASGKVTKKQAIVGYTSDKDLTNLLYIGEFKQYYNNGKIQQTTSYDLNGIKDGAQTIFYKNGTVHQTLHYSNGQLNGTVSTFHQNGKLESEEQYINNKHADGECKHYDELGRLSRLHHYKNGVFDGQYTDYYENGKVQRSAVYKEGHHQQSQSFYSNGVLRSDNYNKGNQQISDSYNEQGQLVSREFSITTEIHTYQSAREYWYDNGQQKLQESFDENVRQNGVRKEWYENGQLKKEERYNHGDLESLQTWTEQGKPTEERYYHNRQKNGTHKKWDSKTGHLVYEITYKDGNPVTPEKTYDANTGQLATIDYLGEKSWPIATLIDGKAPRREYNNGKLVSIRCGYSDRLLNPDNVRQKAKANDSEAQTQLAWFYYMCNAPKETLYWYNKAADNNDLEALNKLSYIYSEGNNVFKALRSQGKRMNII
ncbi:hypothetical protein [Marinomonas sp.]|uniref:hypothetical protein n=1 Tax=Marinomonas sp. TaxID=1904862 RepID=UPI003BAC98F9